MTIRCAASRALAGHVAFAATIAAMAAALATTAALAQAPARAPAPAAAPATDQERALAAEVAKCPIKAQPAYKDFGFVPPNTTVNLDATLVNPLDRPVTCIRSVPTCQCTTLDMLGKVIPARGSITVPVSMKTSGATGPKVAAVRMMFEGVPGIVEVKLNAEVAYSIHGSQTNTYPGRAPQQDAFVNAFDFPHQTKGEVTVESVDKQPFRVVSLMGAPPSFVGFDPATDAPRASYKVRYDFSAASCAETPKYLVIETDRPDALLIDLRVRHACTRIDPAFSFGQYRENLGAMPVGEPREFAVEIKHANGVRIDAVQSLDPRLAVQIVSRANDGDSQLITLRATTQPGAQGVIMSSLRFIGVGPDPKRPVPPGQPVTVEPRMADYLLYYKAVPKSAAAPADKPTASAQPAESAMPAVNAMPDATRAAVLATPTAERDARVNAAKMTRLADPTVPSRVVQPLPVVQRIAQSPDQVPMDPAKFALAQAAVSKALAYFERAQGPNGGWMEAAPAKGTDQAKSSNASSVAVTGLVLKAFAQSGRTAAKDKHAERALAFALANTRMGPDFNPDPQGGLSNYVASMLLMGLAAQDDAAVTEHMATVRHWLVANQWDQSKGIAPADDWYGGAGYGRNGRPDLSNTQVMLDALHDAGVSPDDPAVQRALAFVQRTQNIRSNPAAWAQAGSADGGFVYTPANGGESFASDVAGEGRYGEKMPEGSRSLRSYGSMTYAGFKSLLYAGMSPTDPQVTAAFDWIRRNFTFNENPGLGDQGHYYYLHAMARALHAANTAVIVDASGASHAWRDELVDALLARQAADGSWVNRADRWMESQPDLVTAYATLALQEALKPVLQTQ